MNGENTRNEKATLVILDKREMIGTVSMQRMT